MKRLIRKFRNWRYLRLYRKILMMYARKCGTSWDAKSGADSLFMYMTGMDSEEFNEWYYFSFRE